MVSRVTAVVLFCLVLSLAGLSQEPVSSSSTPAPAPITAQTAQPAPPAGSNWRRVQTLPPRTGLHVTTDHGGVSCRVFAVTEDTLICAKGGAAGRVLARGEIRHIKLTHYVRSTLVGFGVGAGAGAIGGAIGGREKPCPASTTTGFGVGCLNGIGIGTGGVAAIFAVAGGVLGAAIGGPTDFARGSSIYVRP